MIYRNHKTFEDPYLGLCIILLLKAPQELTDSIAISTSCRNYSPSSKSHVFSSHNYFGILYQLLKDTVHRNIVQNTLTRDKTWPRLLQMNAEAVSSTTW